MTRYLCALLLLLLLQFTGFTQQKSVAINTAKWKTAATDSYSVKYPPDWQWDHSAQMGTLFFIFSPLTSATDKFKENFNLMTEDVSPYNVTLDKYVEGSKGSVQNLLKNAKFLSDKREYINGRECRHLTYTGDKDMLRLYFDAYVFLVRGRTYLFTFTGEQKVASGYLKTIGAMASTLQFK